MKLIDFEEFVENLSEDEFLTEKRELESVALGMRLACMQDEMEFDESDVSTLYELLNAENE